MRPLASIGNGFYRCWDFRGRAQQSEFAWWLLFALLTITASVAFSAQFLRLGQYQTPPVAVVVALAPALVLVLPSLAVTVRRMHDMNYTGWWLLLELVCSCTLPVVVILCLVGSSDGPNKYGPAPGGSPNPDRVEGSHAVPGQLSRNGLWKFDGEKWVENAPAEREDGLA